MLVMYLLYKHTIVYKLFSKLFVYHDNVLFLGVVSSTMVH